MLPNGCKLAINQKRDNDITIWFSNTFNVVKMVDINAELYNYVTIKLLLFLIFINDIPTKLECNLKIFADTLLFFLLFVTQMKARKNLAET